MLTAARDATLADVALTGGHGQAVHRGTCGLWPRTHTQERASTKQYAW